MNNFESEAQVSDFVPWHDTKKWQMGVFYPLPHSEECEFMNVTVCVLGAKWGIYRLNPTIEKTDECFGDIDAVMSDLSMQDAFTIAEFFNSKVII